MANAARACRPRTSLLSTGEPATGNRLLDAALRGRSNAKLTSMIAELRRRNEPAVLEAAAEWIRATHDRLGPSNVNGILRQVGLSEYAGRGSRLARRRVTAECHQQSGGSRHVRVGNLSDRAFGGQALCDRAPDVGYVADGDVP